MRPPASLNLSVALGAAALGFGLVGGPAAVIAQVVAVVCAARFVFSLRDGAPATLWTENLAWPSQLFFPPQILHVSPS